MAEKSAKRLPDVEIGVIMVNILNLKNICSELFV